MVGESFVVDFRCCSHHFFGLLLYFLMNKENPLDEHKTLRLKYFVRFDAKVEKEVANNNECLSCECRKSKCSF